MPRKKKRRGKKTVWVEYGSPHGWGKDLVKEVAARYRAKSFNGQKMFSQVKIKKKKMPYGETRYFILGKWR